MKFFLTTLGCRTNQADSAAIRATLMEHDLEETGSHADADLIVVNSCTVTHRTDQQVRQLTRKLRRGNPGARIVVTGCYAQRDPAALAQIEGVDAVCNSHLAVIMCMYAQRGLYLLFYVLDYLE